MMEITWEKILLIAVVLYFFVLKKSVRGMPQPVSVAFDYVLRTSDYSALTYYWQAISKMETAGWTSPNYKQFQNLFGMRQPKTRQTMSRGGTASGFAKYDTLNDSVMDLILFMDEWKYPKTAFVSLRSFVEFIQSKGYCPELSVQEYYDRVNAWLNR